MMTSKPDVSRLEAIARVVERLSVLLAAGVSPATAWGYVESPEFGELVSLVAARSDEIPATILENAGRLDAAERTAWCGIAAAWSVSSRAGAPLAASLSQFAVALRSLADAQRETSVALAGPVATAKLVMALPAVGVVFGMLLGFDTLGTLFTTGPGLACLCAGGVLLFLGRGWNRRLVRAAQTVDSMPGLRLELTAIAVGGGGALDRAVAAVDAAMIEFGFEAHDTQPVVEVLDLSRRAGVPAAALLRSEAAEARRDARASAQAAATVLGVTLMLPLGLCVLPAFMLLGVAPMLIAVVSSTVDVL